MRISGATRCGSLLGLIAIAATLLMPANAEARCKKANIKGSYQIHISIRQDKQQVWASCKIRVARNGSVRAGSTCDLNSGSSAAIGGGSLRVNRACSVSGTITIGSEDNVIAKATMSPGKEIFAGVGALGSKPTNFIAVRL